MFLWERWTRRTCAHSCPANTTPALWIGSSAAASDSAAQVLQVWNAEYFGVAVKNRLPS
jgi:hypothetical protein